MFRRLTYIMPLLLLACASPEEQTRQQAWGPIEFADQNRCSIQGFQEGTDAFAQCVRMTIDRLRRLHRCTYCRSVD
jgi:hypothetical protein